jgi:large subunit ribosomal protein L10
VKKEQKERVVADLAERLRTSETLIVADYRGLTMPQIDALRGKLIEHGARFAVVKNTLTRRAAEAAGAEALLALLDGPTAIAFLESDGDPVAVAKALADSARETRVLTIRGGILEGRPIEAGEVEELAKLPPADILRGQVLGAITSPLQTIVGLFTAPLQDLYGLLDARIEQLGGPGDTPEAEAAPESPPESDAAAPTAEADAQTAESQAEAADAEPPPAETAETTEDTTNEPQPAEEEQ